MSKDDILDFDLGKKATSENKLSVDLISTNKFIILSIVTFGIYEVWWMYKSWKFLKEKDSLDIIPAARAIFSVLFALSLFERIQNYAQSNGYNKSYSSNGLFIVFLILTVMSKLPDPYWLISFFSIVSLIQPHKALNYAISNSNIYEGQEQVGFNTRQIILMIFGLILFSLVIIGIAFPEY